MIYTTKKGNFRAKIYQKFRWESVIRFLAMSQKTTPTVKYRRWLNIISPKMHQSIKEFHKQNLIFQILLTPIVNSVTILSTDLIENIHL